MTRNFSCFPLGSLYETMKQVRDGANRVKREEPVMVVIGNPPYVDKAKGTSSWIETSVNHNSIAPSIAAFRKQGNGKLEYVLSNKYIYFWRWATWKTFDAHHGHPAGVVAMICSAGFTDGAGFAGMREYLRRTVDEGWIIDLSPEGHQPPMDTRVFRGNQQPICIAIFVRSGDPNPDSAALVHRIAVSGTFEEKCDRLARLTLKDVDWRECVTDWPAPFSEPENRRWLSMPRTIDLMPWAAPGVKSNRTWVYAPERHILEKRWSMLTESSAEEKAALFWESDSRKVDQVVGMVRGMVAHCGTILEESGPCPVPRRVAYRSFDRQWIIPDARVHHRPSSTLWSTYSNKQVFLTEQHTERTKGGIGLSFTGLIPEMDHFMGNHGGRVLPLYRDSDGKVANVTPGLLEELSRRLEIVITPLELMAYVAAVTAHGGYTRRFKEELKRPGVRIPLTGEPQLWKNAIHIGYEVLWLHTYGDRCENASAGRPSGPPRMKEHRPKVQVTIPDTVDGMPEEINFDEQTATLEVGSGRISPVSADVWNYRVSGMRVVKHWFDYRKKKPSGLRKSALDRIVAQTWTPAMTTELLELLNVLGRCVELESKQVALLASILESSCISVTDLAAAGVLPVPPSAAKPPGSSDMADLFSITDHS